MSVMKCTFVNGLAECNGMPFQSWSGFHFCTLSAWSR